MCLMSPRLFLVTCFGLLAAATLASVAVGVWLIASKSSQGAEQLFTVIIVYGGGIAFLLVAFIAIVWGYLDHAIAQPLSSIVRGIQTVIHANPDHAIEVSDLHQLGSLPTAVNHLVRHLAMAKNHVDETVKRATASIEEEKTKLAIILQDLHEGVIVCNSNHRILLYNNRALELLRISGGIGLDRALFNFMARQPILHALGRLNTRLTEGRYHGGPDSSTVQFVGSAADGRFMLNGRLSLMLDADDTPTGYVISFEDDTEELATLALRDRLLRESTEGLRAPVANLRAATEILNNTPELSDTEQQEFKQVLLKETEFLSDRLEVLSGQYRDIITGHWPMSDIYSSNFFQHISGRFAEEPQFQLMMVGIPQWLHGDSYTLVELMDRMIRKVSDYTGATAFDLEAVAGEKHVYLDLIWHGCPVPAAELDGWAEYRLEDTLGGLTLREVIDRHKTDFWSLADRDDRARLRLPLPPAQRSAVIQDLHQRPPRPEFYDFELLRRPEPLGELGQQPLRTLNYVVFDTETTGLEPSAGDEIISIAGVRLVNGRILTGESFERIVDPQRPIPRESIRFHGITEDMVKDKPPIQVVLPQFREYVGDAILVAHNAAFDLKFLRIKEFECGVTFDLPVLDTLLLSVFLHDHTSRHGLDAVAKRFGITIQGRHTALGDSLVTAGVFLKMIDVLEARGITTLDQAIDASHTIVELRAKQASY
ncbi:MAG: exonuclease [Hyphomicrobiales bacterium]|nr:exonuclease [Hyphomicrobiales bacterium]